MLLTFYHIAYHEQWVFPLIKYISIIIIIIIIIIFIIIIIVRKSLERPMNRTRFKTAMRGDKSKLNDRWYSRSNGLAFNYALVSGCGSAVFGE